MNYKSWISLNPSNTTFEKGNSGGLGVCLYPPARERILYPLQGFIIDEDFGLWAVARRVFPGVPIQLCVRHAENFLNYHFLYQYQGSGRDVEKFLEIAHEILYAPDVGQWHQRVTLFQDYRTAMGNCGLEAEFFSFLEKIPYTGTHFFYLGMLRTNNLIEVIIRSLSRRIDDTDGFDSFETACMSLFYPALAVRKFEHTGKCCAIFGRHDLVGQSVCCLR